MHLDAEIQISRATLEHSEKSVATRIRLWTNRLIIYTSRNLYNLWILKWFFVLSLTTFLNYNIEATNYSPR
jgi:hypothetical protein